MNLLQTSLKFMGSQSTWPGVGSTIILSLGDADPYGTFHIYMPMHLKLLLVASATNFLQ